MVRQKKLLVDLGTGHRVLQVPYQLMKAGVAFLLLELIPANIPDQAKAWQVQLMPLVITQVHLMAMAYQQQVARVAMVMLIGSGISPMQVTKLAAVAMQ